MGERRGRGKSRNMNKGLIGMEYGGLTVGVGRTGQGRATGKKMEQL